MTEYGDWRGGKPGGTLTKNKNKNGWILMFQNPYLYKNFLEKYENIEKVRKIATMCRYSESKRRGITKNMWRVVCQGDEKWAEVQLQNDHIMLCDLEDIPYIEKCVWYAILSSRVKETYHVSHSARKNLDPEKFHRLVMNYPHVKHVNGNGLDNRKKNLVKIEKSLIEKKTIQNDDGWNGGKSTGSIRFCDNRGYSIRFQKPYLYQFSSISDYETQEKAKLAAELFQYEESKRRGAVKNMWRIVCHDEDEKWIEVRLQNNRVMLCDQEDLPIVEKYIWIEQRSHKVKDLSYVMHSSNSSIGLKAKTFHKLIVDHEVVDHINGNGLDNRKKNLRDGSGTTTDGSKKLAKGTMNARNQRKRHDNISGKTGVHYSNYDRAWIVQWPTDNGKRKKKTFRVYEKRSYEEAKTMAIAFRKGIDTVFGITNGIRELSVC